VRAEEAQYKLKIHKQFLKEVIDKNFPVMLEHIEWNQEKDTFLPKPAEAEIKKFTHKIIPRHPDPWDVVQSDFFFDEGEMVMEINNLQYKGEGYIIPDASTGK
jgi:hypothetical protein